MHAFHNQIKKKALKKEMLWCKPWQHLLTTTTMCKLGWQHWQHSGNNICKNTTKSFCLSVEYCIWTYRWTTQTWISLTKDAPRGGVHHFKEMTSRGHKSSLHWIPGKLSQSLDNSLWRQNNSLLQFAEIQFRIKKTRLTKSMTWKCHRAIKEAALEISEVLSRVMPLQRNYHGPLLILSIGRHPGSVRVEVLEFLEWFHTLEKWLEEEGLQRFEVELEERVQLKKQLTVTSLVLARQIPETVKDFQKFLLNLLAGCQRFVWI